MITKEAKIIDILQQYPQAIEVFERFKMGCVGCMGMTYESIENGAKMHHVSLTELLEELNKLEAPGKIKK